jgi:alpha-ketoglutarate-dependent taurine dioxygenase
MAVITAEKLGATVGAQVHGVDRERLIGDESLPQWTLDALEQNGVLVFRDLHVDDVTQVAFSRKLGTVEIVQGGGDPPEIFRVTLDPRKNRSAAYLRGTFYWHIDGCTDDIPIMATVLSAHAVAESGGETEFASTYGAYDVLPDDEKAHVETVRVIHTIEASQRLHNPDPSAQEVELWRKRPAKEHPLVWTHRSGRKSLVLGATTDHVVGMQRAEGACAARRPPRSLDGARSDLPPPVAGRRHGDLGQPRSPAPGLSLPGRLPARHAPDHARRERGDPVTTRPARVAIVTGGASGIGLAISERLAADGNRRRDLRRATSSCSPAPTRTPVRDRGVTGADITPRAGGNITASQPPR